MTRAEYLEYVQEALAFPELTDYDPETRVGMATDPISVLTLRDTPEVCKALKDAHEEYCRKVEDILFPGRYTDADLKEDGVPAQSVGTGQISTTEPAVAPPPVVGSASLGGVQTGCALLTGGAQDAEDAKLTRWQLEDKYKSTFCA